MPSGERKYESASVLHTGTVAVAPHRTVNSYLLNLHLSTYEAASITHFILSPLYPFSTASLGIGSIVLSAVLLSSICICGSLT